MKKKTTLICFVKYPALRWALNRIHEQKKDKTIVMMRTKKNMLRPVIVMYA